jgi:hypothetical protein
MKTTSLQFIIGPLGFALRLTWFLVFVLVVIPLAWLAFKVVTKW